jgi:hypothetical protein
VRTAFALRQWLAYEIHGRVLRKPPGKERRGPARCEDYKAWVRTLPCVACGIEGCSEAAHVGTDGGMSMKATDYSCVPLCSNCHTQAPGAYHRIGKRAFERAHGLCFAVEVRRLNAAWEDEIHAISATPRP